MSSIGKLMKQASKLQQQMQAVQQSLSQRTVEATSGGGVVKVVARCDGSIMSVKIDPQAVNPDDVTLLEDMVLSAVNSGLEQARDVSQEEMSKVTGGLGGLPGMGF